MIKGKKNKDVPEGIDTTYLDTRVDNETKTKTTRLKKGNSTKYMHHTNKKNIKSQNRNKNIELFTQTLRGFLLHRFRSPCATNVRHSLRRSTISPATDTATLIPATSAEKNSAVPITRNATRNPTTIRLPVPFVVNILRERKACSVPGLSTKDLKRGQGC